MNKIRGGSVGDEDIFGAECVPAHRRKDLDRPVYFYVELFGAFFSRPALFSAFFGGGCSSENVLLKCASEFKILFQRQASNLRS